MCSAACGGHYQTTAGLMLINVLLHPGEGRLDFQNLSCVLQLMSPGASV